MRQKFVISIDSRKDQLKLREYAIVDKSLIKVSSAMLRRGDYQLLCEETYDSKKIVRSIPKGTEALVSALRSRNIFPIEPYAAKIAESVAALYSSPEDGPVELFFDDSIME